MRFRCIFVFILLFCSSLFATELNLSNKDVSYVGEYTSFFEDKDSTYDINKIKNMNKDKFIKRKNRVFISFFSTSTFWLKIDVLNNTNKKLKRYFVFDAPWIDNIDIFIYDKNDTLSSYKIGTLLPFNQRTMKINLLNQVHEFSKGKSTIFLKIKTRDPFIIPLSILSQQSLYEKLMKMNLVNISTYSIVSAILIFNFLIFVIARYKPYFYYSLYLLSYLIMSWGYDSYTFKYVFYDYPIIQNWMQSIPILIYLLCSLLFAKSFLELKTNLPKVNRYTNNILFFHIFMIFITSFLGYTATIFYATCITPLFSLYMLSLGIYSYIKGNKKAIFFTLATLFGCTGALFTALIATSFIDYNWYLFKGVDIGVMIDSILFSIALAYRYTSLNLILEKTKNEVEELNTNLEKKVQERTQKLDLAVKNKTVLLKELSHRVKNNLQIISALLSMDKEKIKHKEDKAILEENINRIKSISILYENFLEVENTNEIDSKEYIKKLISEFQQGLSSMGIDFELDLHENKLTQKELIPIGLVINELITNSIKYAFKNENQKANIFISFVKDKDLMILKYKDNGVGANLSKLKDGFGFSLIDSLISYQLKGKVECKNSEGLEYKITLPL